MTQQPKEEPKIDNQRIADFISRIQRLEAEKKNIAEDIKEVYSEVKNAGYNAKALRTVVKLAQISQNPKLKNAQDELEFCVESYKKAMNID